jgi:hypothetical protein
MANLLGGKADVLYGASGLYKTSEIGWTALYVLEKYGKRTRLVSADGGGFGPIQSLIDAGIVEVWPIRNRLHFIEAVDKACQGWWPVDPRDPRSPIEPPNANPSIREVGLYAFEGLTSFGSGIMGKLKVPGVQLSQDPNYVLRDGETDYAGGSIAAFGFVQDRIYDFVMKSHMIPGTERELSLGKRSRCAARARSDLMCVRITAPKSRRLLREANARSGFAFLTASLMVTLSCRPS